MLHHPTTGRSRAPRSLLLLVCTPIVLGACSGSTAVVTPPKVSGATAETCRELVEDLPRTLLDQEQHDVSKAGNQVQWGDPSLTLTCGVDLPDEVDEFSGCSEMGGTQWYVPTGREIEDAGATVTVHTLGTDPVVRVDVPSEYRPRFDSVVGTLGPVLAAHLTVTQACAH